MTTCFKSITFRDCKIWDLFGWFTVIDNPFFSILMCSDVVTNIINVVEQLKYRNILIVRPQPRCRMCQHRSRNPFPIDRRSKFQVSCIGGKFMSGGKFTFFLLSQTVCFRMTFVSVVRVSICILIETNFMVRIVNIETNCNCKKYG